MITRRNFLKLTGISAAALGGGYSTGKLFTAGSGYRFSVHGFLPADEQYIKRLVTLFRKKIKSSTEADIYGDSRIKHSLMGFDNAVFSSSYSRKGSIVYRIQRLNESFQPDIIISDDENRVYIPEEDFSYSFLQLRNDMKKLKAFYLFTAEYKEGNLFESLFPKEKKIMIENENGIAEILKAGMSYTDIPVEGSIGKTHVSLSEGIARVTSSCCRNKICMHTILSDPQGMIACAPNKIIIRFES